MKSYLPLCVLLCLMVALCSAQGKKDSNKAKFGGNWLKKFKPFFKKPKKNCPNSPFKKYKWKIDLKFGVCQNSKLKQPELSKYQSKQIKRLIPGLFLTHESYLSINQQRLGTEQHDGDTCCPTVRSDATAEVMLQNVDGEWKNLVHLTSLEMYQWVTTASCLWSQCGGDQGQCVLENTIQFLLVWNHDVDPSMPIIFDPFPIPTYCSCKNIIPLK